MIYLFTDFGYHGPYVGEIQALLQRKLTHQSITNLMHDAPKFNPRASAYLLAALGRHFEYGDICMAVVDPGVGDPQRRPLLLEADGVIYIGPDNGLLSVIARRADAVTTSEVTWRPEQLSSSFHGRDLFAPLVVKAALRERFASTPFPAASMSGFDWPDFLAEVIYIDHYGNVVTGIHERKVTEQNKIVIGDQQVSFAMTFSQAAAKQPFWYVNSMGLVEVAVNQDSAAQQLALSIGDSVRIQ